MNVALTLRYSPTALRPTVAWLIGGESSHAWLAQLAASRRSLADARCVVIANAAKSVAINAPLGLLILPAGVGSQAHAQVQAHENAFGESGHVCGVPYSVIADRLYIPTHAMIWPALADAELAERLGDDDSILVWHPGAGLICVDAQHILRCSALLSAPQPSPCDWSRAIPGASLRNRLHSIEPFEPLRFDMLMDAARDDIGRIEPDQALLPRSPDEPTPGIAGAVGRELTGIAARIAQWLARNAPKTASKRTWVNSLGDWAARAIGERAHSLFAQRNAEVLRLMDLLDKNPDEGLRYAIPMGDASHRGLAPGGGSLVAHNTDFSLRRSGGGGAADFWDFDNAYRQRLHHRYRELAKREIGLGRHRRAAYIYAELLGDWNSAAQTLRDGGHYREAAAVYQERLHRKTDAAQCLESGQLWSEAIAVYETLGAWEKIGELYTNLQQPEDAGKYYRLAVDVKTNAGDALGAANLLETKLAVPEEALELLASTWPSSSQALSCALERFRLLGRLARHDAAREAVDQFAGTWTSTPATPQLLFDVATSYPDTTTRTLAADRTRAVVAARLESSAIDSAETLTRMLANLVPDDLLLGRDCQKYRLADEEQRRTHAKKLTRVRRTRHGSRIEQSGQFSLPANSYRAFVRCGTGFLAAGCENHLLRLVRGSFESKFQAVPHWQLLPQSNDTRSILLAVPPDLRQTIVVQPLFEPTLAGTRRFMPTDALPQAWLAGGVPGIDSQTRGAAYNASGSLYSLQHDGSEHLELKVSGFSQQLLQTSHLLLKDPVEIFSVFSGLVPMVVYRQTVFAGIGYRLFTFTPGGEPKIHELPGMASHLAVAGANVMPPQSIKVFVAHNSGCLALTFNARGEYDRQFLAEELEQPKISVLANGTLVCATSNTIEAYKLTSQADGRTTMQHIDTINVRLDGIVDVVPTNQSDGFAILTEVGAGYRYGVTL